MARKIAVLAGVLAFVAGVTQVHAEDGIGKRKCNMLISLARDNVQGAEVETTRCKDCRCGDKKVVTSKHKIRTWLFSLQPCDETVALGVIDQGAVLEIQMTREIRYLGPCQTPIGHHKARWQLFTADGATLMAKGKMDGTDGYNSKLPAADCETCGQPMRQEGRMTGKLVGDSGATWAGYKIDVTYTADLVPRADGEHCEIEAYDLKLTGVVFGSCRSDLPPPVDPPADSSAE